MQITLRNTETTPMDIVFDDESLLSLAPEDELTLQAYMGGSLIVEDGRVQTHGIMSPPYSVSDPNAPGNDPFNNDDEDDTPPHPDARLSL